MGDGHGIEVTATGEHRRRLIVVLVITGAVLIVEVIGGLIAGSLALLADAGHMLTDSTGLILALIAASLATRAATAKRTFGLQRAEVLAALGNALLLVAVAVWVLIQAVDRLRNPVEIDGRLMLVIAVVGALANLAGLLVLRPAQAKSLNMRGAYLEVLGDLLGSLARDRRRCTDPDHRVDALRRHRLACHRGGDHPARLVAAPRGRGRAPGSHASRGGPC